MLLTPYRRAAQAALACCPAPRKPFLRRSLRADALLTTDLPRLASCAPLIEALERQGWQVCQQDGLAELTPPLVPPSAPPYGWGADRPARRRLCSLLSRHPEGAAQPEILAFLKAEEAGEAALTRCCQELWRSCAARLRRGEPLPGELLPYALAALAKEESK